MFFMFITSDVVSQGAFDLCDLINTLDRHLKPGGYVAHNDFPSNRFI